MSELIAISLSWWLVSLSGVLMPGPVSAMAVSEGARRGFIAGPLITAGHAAAEIVMLAALMVGFSQALKQPAVVGGIGVLGGLVLARMGAGIVSAAWRNVLEPPRAGSTPGMARLVLVRAGLLTTIGNPYWLLWWATVGASYFVLFSRFGVAALIALFFVGHIALDLGWNSFLAFAIGAGRGRIPPQGYRIVLGVCGLFVVAMSVYFVYSGLNFLGSR